MLRIFIITARKRCLRRSCFYTCRSVFLFTGGDPHVHAEIPSIPPGPDPPGSGTQPGRYGQPTGGMHPTGMHSCFQSISLSGSNPIRVVFNIENEPDVVGEGVTTPIRRISESVALLQFPLLDWNIIKNSFNPKPWLLFVRQFIV